MLRAASLELGTAKVRVLVADCTPLTACLIAEALRRDRGLTIFTTYRTVSCFVLPLAIAFLPSGRISSFTTRGFGVVATMDTVVWGIFGWMCFTRVNNNPFATSGGRSRRSFRTFSLRPDPYIGP